MLDLDIGGLRERGRGGEQQKGYEARHTRTIAKPQPPDQFSNAASEANAFASCAQDSGAAFGGPFVQYCFLLPNLHFEYILPASNDTRMAGMNRRLE